MLFSGERQNGICFAGRGAAELYGAPPEIFSSVHISVGLKIIVIRLADPL
jgi:hypothetical protein